LPSVLKGKKLLYKNYHSFKQTMLQSLFRCGVLIPFFLAITFDQSWGKDTFIANPKSESGCTTISPLVSGGLENIIVETYYISDNNDSTDTNGGHLVSGSTTYRIYVDMAPGYQLQALYGESVHTFYISTTTGFFNNEEGGQTLGCQINKKKINKNTVALDSWLTFGGATSGHIGILKESDTNGSLLGGTHNDGGSALITSGLLVNTASAIPLTTSDGLIAVTSVPQLTLIHLDMSPFDVGNSGSVITTNNGSLACMDGVQGPTLSNQVLIAQITTTGMLTFEINLQLKSPDGTIEKYVATNPKGKEIQFPGLTRH
jgi:hypothetical protein